MGRALTGLPSSGGEELPPRGLFVVEGASMEHTSLPNLSAGQALKGHERDSDRPLAILLMALPVGAPAKPDGRRR